MGQNLVRPVMGNGLETPREGDQGLHSTAQHSTVLSTGVDSMDRVGGGVGVEVTQTSR